MKRFYIQYIEWGSRGERRETTSSHPFSREKNVGLSVTSSHRTKNRSFHWYSLEFLTRQNSQLYWS